MNALKHWGQTTFAPEVHFWITEAARWRNLVVEHKCLHATLPDDARRRVLEWEYGIKDGER